MHVRNIGNRRSDQGAFDFIEGGLVIAPGVEQVALSTSSAPIFSQTEAVA